MTVHVHEVVPGEYDVRPAPAADAVRVVVPAGVGVPGASEEELAGALIEELCARGDQLPATLDVSQLLRSEPGLLAALERRLDD